MIKKRILLLILSFAMIFSLVSCSQSRTAMKLGDSSINENMYRFWLSTYKADFLSYYNNSVDSASFWQQMATDDKTTEQYAYELINQNIKYILVGIKLFRDYGLKIDADVSLAINEDIEEKIDFYGGRSSLNTMLAKYGVNVDILKDCYIAEEKLYAVYDYLYGSNGVEAMTDAMLDIYYRENYSHVRYLVIYTEDKIVYDENGDYEFDSDGNVLTDKLSDAERAEKQAKIASAMAELEQGVDFAEVMTEYNEADMAAYPNGFFISPNELGVFGYALVSETKQMNVGEIRKIEDEGICYIVEKLELTELSKLDDASKSQLASLESYCVQQHYEKKFSAIAEDITVDESIVSKYSLGNVSANFTF